MADETPQEEYNKYKKEMGKQYMDGLISDTEYDELLKAKEAELGLNEPSIPDDEEGLECPSCGALIGEFDAECGICGIALEPVTTTTEEPEAAPMPAHELGLEGSELDDVVITCPSCGAEISEIDTVCTMCGHVLETELELDDKIEAVEADITKIIDEEPLDDEKTCPSCGAFLDAEATECIICDTPIGETEPVEEIPDMPPAIEAEPSPEDEIVCAGCGAVLDEGASECFICGALVGEEPEATEPVSEPIPEPEIEPLAELPEEIPAPVSTKDDEMDPELLEIQEELLSDDILEEEVPEAEIVEEIILNEGEIICPSCSSVIPEESDKCPECWTDFSLYIRCPACSLLTPSGEDSCRECFAPIEIPDEEITEIGFIPGEMDSAPFDVDIPDEVVITEELREEMTSLEIEEEQGKECLVCGAIFGPEDEVCPICLMEFGTEVEEPEKIDYDSWGTMEVEIVPTVYICPNCGENVTGLDATDREMNEGKWFYRGIISIFIGIFFTSFSIWARGVSAENASLGLNPPPTDVLLNVIGWIIVLIGFVFWFFSWKLHEERVECTECGIEINPDMANCINCGIDLTDGEQFIEEDLPEEELLEDEYYEEPMAVEEPAEVYEEVPEEVVEEHIEDLEVPVETYEEPVEEPAVVPEPVPEPVLEPEPEPVEAEGPGAELPTEHEEHKQCPGCGIFVDLEDSICPVCDTEFEAVETIELDAELSETTAPDLEPAEPVADDDIDILSEDDELAGLGIEEEPTIEAEPPVEAVDEITVPEEEVEHIECPSCGADVEKGTAACPVCEYPLI